MAQYIGCLNVTDDNDLQFYLAARSHPEGDVDHLFVFYLNKDYPDAQLRDLEQFAKYLPKSLKVNIGVINIFCESSPQLYLSSFLVAIDHLLGRQLVANFKPYIKTRVSIGEVAVGPLSTCNLDHCDGQFRQIEQFRSLVREYGHELQLGGSRTKLHNPQVVMMRDNGHLLGIFYNRDYHSITYLVVHRNQFINEQTYARVKLVVSDWYTNGRSLTHHVTRFHANKFRTCDDELVQMAWRLVLWMRPHVLIYITENELQYLMGNLDKMNPWLQEMMHERERPLGGSQVSRRDSPDPEVDVDLIIKSQDRYPHELLRSVLFHVDDHDELWTNNLSTMQELSRERRRIRDSIVPPVHELEPYHDLTQCYLKLLPSYEDGIKLMAQIWSRYAPTYAFSKLSTPMDIEIKIMVAHTL